MPVQLRLLDPGPVVAARPSRPYRTRPATAIAAATVAAWPARAGLQPWSLDERTCEIGRRGVEAARRALSAAPPVAGRA